MKKWPTTLEASFHALFWLTFLQAVLLYIDPDGNKTVFVTSKHPTVVSMNNTLDGEKMSAPLIKAKMAELQKMLTQIEVYTR